MPRNYHHICNTLTYILMNYIFKSDSGLTTEEFATRLGGQLRGGEVIELIGDVGAGKTTFVRGLARGVKSEDPVSSPTFTVCNIYKGHLTLYHYDLYRIKGDALAKSELAELLDNPRQVLVLEWAEEVRQVLPETYLSIRFSVAGESDRVLSLTIPETYDYVEIV